MTNIKIQNTVRKTATADMNSCIQIWNSLWRRRCCVTDV